MTERLRDLVVRTGLRPAPPAEPSAAPPPHPPRLASLVDAEDPAVAELARLVRGAADLDPRPGAQERVRLALAEPGDHRRRWRQPVLVCLALAAATLIAIVGVRKLIAPRSAPQAASVRTVDGDDTRSANAADPATAMRAISPRPASELRTGEAAATRERRSPPLRDAAATPEISAAAAPDLPPEPPRAPEPNPPRRRPVGGFSVPRIAPAQQGSEARVPEVSVTDIAAPANPPPIPSPEAALVLDALRLLRHDHDASGALRLLDTYRGQFRDGDLAEEALALAIEARAALGDGAARGLAAEYLQRFPHGRFHALAEGVLRR
jgi:hypothetical protein